MQKFPMTINGARLLQDELKQLKSVERPKVIVAISEARAQGDLSENAEYDAAKEKQSFIEGRIAEIELKLSLAMIIDPTKIDPEGKIIFGAFVRLLDIESDEDINYQIVGDDEADVKIGKISINSPVAKSLIGKEVGAIVVVKTPSGVKEFEVLDFYYR